MRKLFTCLVVVLLFAGYSPLVFTANIAVSLDGQSFEWGTPSGSYPDYVDPNLPGLACSLPSSRQANVNILSLPFHLSDPIA